MLFPATGFQYLRKPWSRCQLARPVKKRKCMLLWNLRRIHLRIFRFDKCAQISLLMYALWTGEYYREIICRTNLGKSSTVSSKNGCVCHNTYLPGNWRILYIDSQPIGFIIELKICLIPPRQQLENIDPFVGENITRLPPERKALPRRT